MNLHVGTSGYSYKEWKGPFYPPKLPAKEMLRYYAERFRTVEINNTFYGLPKPEAVEAWLREVPSHFRFVLKAPQRVTHFQRLVETRESMAAFLDVAAKLKDHLGPLLFQLPPNMKKDTDRLRGFLKSLPSELRVVFEFRHPSWFDETVFTVLREHQAALCIADADDELEVPFEATTGWGYVRLRRAAYTTPALKKWLGRIREQNWAEAFVFFKHEDEAKGPVFAKKLVELAEKP